MGPIRGFGFNPSAAAGNLNVTASMFGLTIQPDNYCLVNLQPGPSGGSQGSASSGSNVLFSEENFVTTKYANDFRLSFQNASLAYQYLNSSSALSTTSFTVIGNYVYNGLGKVEIYTKDFTSNYTNVLKPDQSLYAAASLDPLGDPSSAAWQVDNIAMNEQPTQTVDIRFDSANSKYYFNLDENINSLNPSDRVYFRGVNTFPTQLNDKKSLLLYTGLRPLVLNVLQVSSSGARTLEACINSAVKFNWNNLNINNDASTINIFTSLDAAQVTDGLGSALSDQFYQVVLTNENASVSPAKSFNYRGALYTLSSNWFQFTSTNPLRNFFGTYEIIAEMFQDLRLNISRTGVGAVSTTYNLQSDYVGLTQNSQANESKIIAGQYGELNYASNVYQTFEISSNSVPDVNQTLGLLFDLSVLGVIGQYASGDGQGFTLNILPAQMSIYTATDANNNGEIDNKKSTNVDHNIANMSSKFGLQNMFSEMNIVLPANAATSYRLPSVISSWELTRDFNSVPIKGCPFDIKLNNRWSVGYNLDCYFTIVTATSAQFDVITVSTKASTNASSVELTNLEVQSTAPLMIKRQTDWARSLTSENGQADNYGSLSGLTFKITNATTNVVAGSIVRLFVDNTIADNTNEWTVNTTSSTNKTYQLYAYDQERYAALLDEQLSINNTFA
jgi:hypothetical protein